MAGISRDTKAQISDLRKASPEGLARHWKSAFGKPIADHLPRHLLVAILAYRVQADAHRTISKEHKRYLDAVGRLLAQNPKASITRYAPEKKLFKPGTVFVREHAGFQHRVVATPEGLLWGDETYPSLSAVARAITGTNWNGRRFFGLPKGGD